MLNNLRHIKSFDIGHAHSYEKSGHSKTLSTNPETHEHLRLVAPSLSEVVQTVSQSPGCHQTSDRNERIFVEFPNKFLLQQFD